jgi:nicotinic acid mononucleotide adenylyltransferase
MPDNPRNSDLNSLIAKIHDAPILLVLAITGGGSRAISELLERPGGSKILLAGLVPYSAAALEHFLGTAPEQFCSARTARLMAMVAYMRGRSLRLDPPRQGKFVGVGCTASLASDRPKRGDHRVHVAFQTIDQTDEYSLTLAKGARSRAEEEAVATAMILNAVAEAAEMVDRIDLPLRKEEEIVDRSHSASPEWQELLHGQRRQVGCGRTPIIASGTRRAIFPGAFNPLHDGHRTMAALAADHLGVPVEFELSIHNVDKPPLDYLEMADRTSQFSEDQTLWLTRAPTFDEKSRLFSDATFVVGADTIARIADPKYYDDDERAMTAAIERIASRGCRFLVFGRRNAEGQFKSLSELDLPTQLSAICDEVPERKFRADVSSTELRRGASPD